MGNFKNIVHIDHALSAIRSNKQNSFIWFDVFNKKSKFSIGGTSETIRLSIPKIDENKDIVFYPNGYSMCEYTISSDHIHPDNGCVKLYDEIIDIAKNKNINNFSIKYKEHSYVERVTYTTKHITF